jgi:hypothetical protein
MKRVKKNFWPAVFVVYAAASGVRLEEVRCFVAVVVGAVFWTFFCGGGFLCMFLAHPFLRIACKSTPLLQPNYLLFFKGRKQTRHRCSICSSHPSKFCSVSEFVGNYDRIRQPASQPASEFGRLFGRLFGRQFLHPCLPSFDHSLTRVSLTGDVTCFFFANFVRSKNWRVSNPRPKRQILVEITHYSQKKKVLKKQFARACENSPENKNLSNCFLGGQFLVVCFWGNKILGNPIWEGFFFGKSNLGGFFWEIKFNKCERKYSIFKKKLK